ncbi:unnamed protein product [Nippostrongylus brasiliensis]|uniref:Transposase n=1 Tax=Nippostrongylus brasiliensis TaxID=27835 RepID=A0A0N4Y957_NIPBR|nr:unnamed protein product [Nippostrongylus brasiliensis]
MHVAIEHWKNAIPDLALRLRIMVDQARNCGLIALVSICQALYAFISCSWFKVLLRIPDNWSRYKAAVRTVGNNPYYGYNRNLGTAASTGYKTLAWVSKELPIRSGAAPTLKDYAG